MFAMFGIVLANNFVMLLSFGSSSDSLLRADWPLFERDAAAEA